MKPHNILLPSLMAASSCYANPTPILDLTPLNSPETDLLVREGIKLARSQDLEKRISADFSLDRSWNNEVLFSDTWESGDPGNEAHANVSVTCLECYTRGTVTARVTDKDFLRPLLRLDFSGVSARASLGVDAGGAQTFSLNLFASDSPIGIGIPGLDVGVVFFVDLVVGLDAAIDLTAGFQVTVPDGAYIEADIFKGDIDDSTFEGLSSQYLPVTVASGTATFKADLRIRVQAGSEASIDLFGIGAGAVIGVYANIIEFVAVIDKTPTCDLETEMWWDLNVGAYAHIDVVVDYTTTGLVPTVSTTLLTAPTISSCWIQAPATTSGGAMGTPTLPSPPAGTGGVSVTSSAAATNAPVTDSTAALSPSTPLIVPTSPELSPTTPGASPSVSISSLQLSETDTTPVVTTAPAVSSEAPASSVHYSSSVGVSSHSYGVGVGTYPILVPSAHSSSSSPSPSVDSPSSSSSATATAAAGPTYTSTYTYIMTRCGVPGVVNCPATYQSEVAVTRTTTFCPAATTSPTSTPTPSASSSSSSSSPAGPSNTDGEAIVVVLTPLPTPIVATFVAPVGEGHSTTTGTTTLTTTVTAIAGHGGFQTPAHLAEPSLGVHASGSNTVVGTGFLPVPTQSAAQTPITAAAAGRLSAFGSAYGAHVAAATTSVLGFLVGVLYMRLYF